MADRTTRDSATICQRGSRAALSSNTRKAQCTGIAYGGDDVTIKIIGDRQLGEQYLREEEGHREYRPFLGRRQGADEEAEAGARHRGAKERQKLQRHRTTELEVPLHRPLQQDDLSRTEGGQYPHLGGDVGTGAEAEEALPLEDGPLLYDFPAGVDTPEPEGCQTEHEVERGRVTLDGPPHYRAQPSDEGSLRQNQDEATHVAQQGVPIAGCQDVRLPARRAH